MPVFGVLAPAWRIFSSFFFFPAAHFLSFGRTQRPRRGITEEREREREWLEMRVKRGVAAWYEVGRKSAGDSGKDAEKMHVCVCVCAIPLCVPFSEATDGPAISQLLGCSRGSGTLRPLFLPSARPTSP